MIGQDEIRSGGLIVCRDSWFRIKKIGWVHVVDGNWMVKIRLR